MPTTPKPAAQRQRRNRITTAAVLEAGPAQKVELPAARPSAVWCAHCSLPLWDHDRKHFEEADVDPHDKEPAALDWLKPTKQWWDTIWASPMVAEWVDADVPDLLAIAVMVDEFWRSGDTRIHAEVRMASREFGLTPMSRRSLQWEIKRLQEPKRPTEAPRPRRSGRSTLSVLGGGKASA